MAGPHSPAFGLISPEVLWFIIRSCLMLCFPAPARVLCTMSAQGSAPDGAEEVLLENQENMPARLRGANKARLENQENLNPVKPGARTVLGALANNPRRQPAALRSSKQVSVGRVARVASPTPPQALTGPYAPP